MSISRQTLSAVIVSYKSDQVIHECIKSISNEIKIIVVDNSNDKNFKENIEKKYSNVKCILSSTNLGMGAGNNLGLRHVETDYAIILNPDVILKKDTIQQIINESSKINSFAILAPLSDDLKYPNYKLDKKDFISANNNNPFKVKSVDGFAMVLNLIRINQIKNFKNHNYFDENFFMYLEDVDLNRRIHEKYKTIFYPHQTIYHGYKKASGAINKELLFHIKSTIYYFNKWGWIIDKKRKKINNQTIKSLKNLV